MGATRSLMMKQLSQVQEGEKDREANVWYSLQNGGEGIVGCRNDGEAGQKKGEVREKLVKTLGYVPEYGGFYGCSLRGQAGVGTYNLI